MNEIEYYLVNLRNELDIVFLLMGVGDVGKKDSGIRKNMFLFEY